MSKFLLFTLLGMVVLCVPAVAEESPEGIVPSHQPRSDGRQSDRSSAEEAIEKALDSPTTCEFIETPLLDVVEYLRDLHGVNIAIDWKALGAAKPDPTSAAVSIQCKGTSLRSALELILRPLKLTWAVHHEALLVTTPEEAQGMLTTRVYTVGDLVAGMGADRAEQDMKRELEDLVDVITATVAVKTWDFSGGTGSMAAATVGDARVLIVSQSYRVHHELEALLEKLREAKAAAKQEPSEQPAPAQEQPGEAKG